MRGIATISFALLLCACSSRPPVEVYIQDDIQQIEETNIVQVKPAQLPPKPKAHVIIGVPEGEEEPGQFVAFTPEDAKKLLAMRDNARINIEYIEQLNALNAAIVNERNKLLDLAKDEEVRANKLRIQLEEVELQRQQEKLESTIEINAWRIMTIIIGIAAL